MVELSLHPLFGRQHSELFKAIHGFELSEADQWRLMAPFLPRPQERPFWLLSVDVVPHPRPYAETLANRTAVYHPQAVKGQKPITIGHAYSTLLLLPEREAESSPWVIPLSVRRSASDQDREGVGADQLQALLTHPDLPFGQELCVVVGDASYSKRGFLVCQSPFPNLVLIARLRNNRVCYRPPVVQGPGARGRPRRYGPRFALNDPVTWPVADQEERFQVTSAQGRRQQVHLQAWHDMRMRGSREWPLHAHPFTLVRIQVTDEEGKPLHRRPLWLLVMGRDVTS
ncbi:MAG: hypothetical protein KatS3mg050_2744 [Litorilinea sp.]|nr:MAG: hypothetical protein KatS3mg050_2744 [Litorilinea sp.]